MGAFGADGDFDSGVAPYFWGGAKLRLKSNFQKARNPNMSASLRPPRARPSACHLALA